MSSAEYLKQFIIDKLAAAAEEIFAVFHTVIVEYEEELERRRKLFDVAWNPVVKLRRIELPQRCVSQEEVIVSDQLSLNQDKSSNVDQGEPEPPQITPLEELSSGELRLKQEPEILQLFSYADEENNESEDQTVDWHPGEPLEEFKVKIPIITSAVSEANSELQQHSFPTAVSHRHTQEEGEHESGQNQVACHLNGCDLSSPGASSQPIKIQTTKKPCVSEECGRSSSELKLKQEPEDLLFCSADQESQPGDWNPEESSDDLKVKISFFPSVVSEANNDLQQQSLSSAVSQSQAENEADHEFESKFLIQTRDGKNRLVCNASGCEFSSPGTVSQCIGIQTDEKPNVCQECGKRFLRKSSLIIHQRIHTGERPYVCQTCGKGFTQPYSLKIHERIHTGEKPYACQECNKRFSDNKTLKLHIRTHTGERQYVCQTCGKALKEKVSLQLHERLHTNKRPFVCHTCPKSFTRKAHLIAHYITHTSEKPFACQTCGKHFKIKSTLTAHEKSHADEKPFLCKMCGKGFCIKSKLIKHNRVHTGERPYDCQVCGKNFSGKGTLKQHLKVHTGERPHVCQTCGKGFAIKRTLDDHKRTHTGEKPYVCTTCSKGFTLKRHLDQHVRVHTGERPYICKACGKGFASTNAIRYHLKSAHRGQ